MGDKLPVWSTAWHSATASGNFIRRYRGLFALLVAIDFVTTEVAKLMPMEPGTSSLRSIVWSTACLVIRVALSAPIILAAHRSILTGDTIAPYNLRAHRVRSFAAAAIGYLLVFEASGGPIGWLIQRQDASIWWTVIGGVLAIASLVFSIRLVLAFPLIAIDQTSPFQHSMALTNGRWWRICFTTAVPGVVIGVAKLLATDFGPVLPSAPSTTIVIDLGNAVADSYIYLTVPCALSLIYLWIRSDPTIETSLN